MSTIGIFGANGRMGRALITVAKEQQLKLTAATVRSSSAFIGVDAGELAGVGRLGLPLSATGSDSINQADIWVDFTMPEAMLAHLELAVAAKKAMVIGVTGLTDAQYQQVQQASAHIPIVWAPNMSVGVNLLLHLVQTAAKVMGQTADIEIIEAHHRFKKDAPSGTAMAIGASIAKALERDLSKVAVYSREGITGERQQQTIGFATVRGGDIIGDHTALFADLGERLEITHKASSRNTFAQGALRAALWLQNKQPGLYSMQQVLGLADLS
ncbi:MAG: 4-hydroxy-tetrahydrodipicolinate reductase [Gammaproteobacteria bacterium]|nr:4-hydroxy-tetrahydrodipicolinate reductase [Gammaproteobacteria bacterium]MBU1556166.1 4-hydroxy-tetrahydrodipicolinate reductase [Gammaproteobacteria bacterium]MBU2070427.1 4-hydroxy-tetrahydrodipicolinate reductase [Gammaproteobacteria bacterium]MBU2184711.1 4-hydroxy-tetrahydrodipicolinate reductase [Gammaproteobacteria bacterium]MBU2203648.1 4-hydroxy-tetrahydrodipicolinate reductase [Gammaproteobacteria bacterium]